MQSIGFISGRWSGGIAVALALLAPAAARAQSTAGTAIPNTAHARVGDDDIASNTAVVRVAELLDIALAAPTSLLTLGAGERTAIPFTLTNTGNGREAFQLSGTLSSGLVEGFAIDSDGDGRFDPVREPLLDKSVTAALAPGASLSLLAIVRSETPGASDELAVTARAVTGSGNPGTVIAGKGDGGVDAVVGSTTAAATLRWNGVGASGAEAVLEKTQRVISRLNNNQPFRGSTIVYTLTARFNRAGPSHAAVVSDVIPAGTAYVPGSLRLDSRALSDAADADAGSFDGDSIEVQLGEVAGPASFTIQFRVTIQ